MLIPFLIFGLGSTRPRRWRVATAVERFEEKVGARNVVEILHKHLLH
jgi:hypothetical protein